MHICVCIYIMYIYMLHPCINGFWKIRNQYYLLIKSVTFSDYCNVQLLN